MERGGRARGPPSSFDRATGRYLLLGGLDLARGEQLRDCRQLGDDLGAVRRLDAHLAEADTAVLDGVDGVPAAGERALLDVLDHLEDAQVDLLDRAREDERTEEALVG